MVLDERRCLLNEYRESVHAFTLCVQRLRRYRRCAEFWISYGECEQAHAKCCAAHMALKALKDSESRHPALK